ncbi:MAG TPA: lipoyl synthase [Limnochordia bacterium]
MTPSARPDAHRRKPPWLTKRLPDPRVLNRMRSLLDGLGLHTICESASCPNIGECWAKQTATFLILGDVCTRRCGFCDVTTGRPGALDPFEPLHVARAVAALGLSHAVVTSVARDDLPDGGASHFAQTIRAIRRHNPSTTVEVLIPDFDGIAAHLETVLGARPDILAHNIETVPRLHRKVRPRFRYRRSLEVLAESKRRAPEVFTKSNLMVGLGESPAEVEEVMADLRAVDCDFLTIGQYLRPSEHHLPVVEYVHPDVFERYKARAEAMGFRHVAAGPFVRSSYDAASAMAAVGRAKAPLGGDGGG